MAETAAAARPGPSRRRDRFGQTVEPGATLRPVGRVLSCSRCGMSIDVLEATQGARTLAEHRWLDPGTYVGFVCGCLRVKKEQHA